MTKNTKNKLLIAACFAGLMFCAWFAAIFWAKSSYEKNKELFTQVTEAETRREYAAQLGGLIEKTAAGRTVLASSFLTIERQAEMMDRLDQMAREDKMIFDLRNASEDGEKVKFDVGVEGTFSQIFEYFSRLDNWPYNSRLTDVKMEKNGSRWVGQAILEVYRPSTKK